MLLLTSNIDYGYMYSFSSKKFESALPTITRGLDPVPHWISWSYHLPSCRHWFSTGSGCYSAHPSSYKEMRMNSHMIISQYRQREPKPQESVTMRMWMYADRRWVQEPIPKGCLIEQQLPHFMHVLHAHLHLGTAGFSGKQDEKEINQLGVHKSQAQDLWGKIIWQ